MDVTSDIILLTDNTQDVYKAGGEVQGIVKYTINEPTEFTSATVALQGKGSCHWRGGLFHYCIGTEAYVDQHIDLFEAKKAVTIAAGTYEKEFRFVLPHSIPSSYKDLRCSIEYYVELEFLKATGIRFSKRCDLNKVQGGITPCLEQPPTMYEVATEDPTSKELVTFNVEVDKTNLIPGENITVKHDIKNLAGTFYVVRTELIEYITFKSNCNHEKQVSDTVNGAEVKSFSAKMKAHIHNCQLTATTTEMFTIHSNILTREYRVKVSFKLPSPAKEVHVEIPIVIAEKIVVSEEARAVDLPPSYSQVMNEEEKVTEVSPLLFTGKTTE